MPHKVFLSLLSDIRLDSRFASLADETRDKYNDEQMVELNMSLKLSEDVVGQVCTC